MIPVKGRGGPGKGKGEKGGGKVNAQSETASTC